MAILKSLIVRGGRKQIGGMVLYTRNGETIARELAPQITNPRTPSQMEQRIKLSNLVSVYRANSKWMRDSFENKKERESDYNAFVSANVDSNQVALSKSDVAAGAAVVGPYKITSGSLPVIETLLNGVDLVTNIYVGNLVIGSETTIGDLSQAILDNNGGIVSGMQLSIVINLQLAAAGSGVPYITTRTYEMIINPLASELITDVIPDNILEVVGTTTKSLGLLTSDLGDGAAAFILSHTTGGRTRVSTQSLVFFGSNAIYRQFTSETAKNAAIASYGENADTFLSSNSAAGASSVVATLALLGMDIDGQELVAGSQLTTQLSGVSEMKFLFNRAIAADAVVSAYYRIGNAATKYNLNNVSVDAGRRSISGLVNNTTLPTYGASFTCVAVINGDEFPITLRNAEEHSDE